MPKEKTVQELKELSDRLKGISQELDCPVMITAHPEDSRRIQITLYGQADYSTEFADEGKYIFTRIRKGGRNS